MLTSLWFGKLFRENAAGPETDNCRHNSSGAGEAILKSTVAATVAAQVGSKVPLKDAVALALQKLSRLSDGMPCAILAMDHRGQICSQSTGRIFSTATSSSYAPPQASMWQTNVPILAQHEFYCDGLIRAGLTRYPTIAGQAVVEIQNGTELIALDFPAFDAVFASLRSVIGMLQKATHILDWGLSTGAGSTMALLPLGQQMMNGQPIASQVEQQTNHSNPTRVNFDPVKLGEFHALISGSTQANGTAAEHSEDQEVRAPWTIWSDAYYIATLSPSGSVCGECILRPRASFDNDVDSLQHHRLRAMYDVMQLLKSKLDLVRCGIHVDDRELGCGVVILIPYTRPEFPVSPVVPSPASFTSMYEGYITSQLGPLAKEKEEMSRLAAKIRATTLPPKLMASKSWESPLEHAIKALRDPWYEAMFALQSDFYHFCVRFFQVEMGYDYVLSPMTSDCISSPMGLGSDSLPVQIPLHGRKTYLADSMQFTLEYMLRIGQGRKGAYYISPSFRGEDPDSSHLNQFYHVECELPGGMDDGMEVMERFVVSIADAMLRKHGRLIKSIAGDTSHISNLVAFAKNPVARFPKVTLEEALEICGHDSDAWEFAVPEAPEKGRKLTRRGERMVMAKYGELFG